MPHVAPHALAHPCYHTDARGTRWRVYDLVPGALVAPGAADAARAISRWFVREGDRWTFVGPFVDEGTDGPRDDPRDGSPAALERQLGRALRCAPLMRRGEAMPDYLARQQVHIASRPDLFTPGGHRRPRATAL